MKWQGEKANRVITTCSDSRGIAVYKALVEDSDRRDFGHVFLWTYHYFPGEQGAVIHSV